MKRPNIKRMQKHAARSAPDRVRRTFELTPDVSNLIEVPGFQEWVETFMKKMRVKHGHEPKIDISTFMNENFSTIGRDIVVALKYQGPLQTERRGYIKTQKEINAAEIRRAWQRLNDEKSVTILPPDMQIHAMSPEEITQAANARMRGILYDGL
jgi:hypothetical protein